MYKKSFLSVSPIILFLIAGLFFSQPKKKQQEPSRKISSDLWEALLKGGQQYGPKNAPVTVVEFIDYMCPHCMRFTEHLAEFEKNYPGKVRVVIHNFPLVQHRESKAAAISAICVDQMGNFRKYHELLFANQRIFYRQPWDSLAGLAGVKDLNRFNGCMTNNEEAMKKLKYDFKLAMKIRLFETPTIIINRQLFNGDISYQVLKQTIQDNLKSSL